ncbi:MAG: hypothetical protein EAZ31_08695 [Cytophagia bacterium]|nr:MAG: hypothetical protein EAZ31_08695 [Cytophagia bacterium]
MHFGKLIQEKAKMLGFSTNALAEATNKNVHTVYGDFKKESIHTDVIEQYCKGMGIDFIELFDVNDQKNELQKNSVIYSKQANKEVVYTENDIPHLQKVMEALEADKAYLLKLTEQQRLERQKILDMYHEVVQQLLQQKNSAT